MRFDNDFMVVTMMGCSEEFMTWYLAECLKLGKEVDFDVGFYLYQMEIQKRLEGLE